MTRRSLPRGLSPFDYAERLIMGRLERGNRPSCAGSSTRLWPPGLSHPASICAVARAKSSSRPRPQANDLRCPKPGSTTRSLARKH